MIDADLFICILFADDVAESERELGAAIKAFNKNGLAPTRFENKLSESRWVSTGQPHGGLPDLKLHIEVEFK